MDTDKTLSFHMYNNLLYMSILLIHRIQKYYIGTKNVEWKPVLLGSVQTCKKHILS
jgi:hypothetical protein